MTHFGIGEAEVKNIASNRRFVTPDHLEPLARVMAPGAELRVATDIPDYVRQTLEEVPKAGFEWRAERPADWRLPWDDWLSTRYEQKALREGRALRRAFPLAPPGHDRGGAGPVRLLPATAAPGAAHC